MSSSKQRVLAAIFAFALLALVDTAVLLYGAQTLFATNAIAVSTAATVLLHEVAFFAVAVLITVAGRRNDGLFAVRLGYGTVIVLCTLTSFLLMGAFNALVWLGWIDDRVFVTGLFVRSCTLIGLLLLVYIVGSIQRGGHAAAEAADAQTRSLLARCDGVLASSRLMDWRIDKDIQELARCIRFSEGVRLDAQTRAIVYGKLEELDHIVRTPATDEQRPVARAIVTAARVFAQRKE